MKWDKTKLTALPPFPLSLMAFFFNKLSWNSPPGWVLTHFFLFPVFYRTSSLWHQANPIFEELAPRNLSFIKTLLNVRMHGFGVPVGELSYLHVCSLSCETWDNSAKRICPLRHERSGTAGHYAHLCRPNHSIGFLLKAFYRHVQDVTQFPGVFSLRRDDVGTNIILMEKLQLISKAWS